MDHEAVKEQVRDTYTRIAEHFDLTRYRPWPETFWFASMLEPGAVVADLGCGNGRNTLCLAEFGHRVLAVDFVQRMLDISRQKVVSAGLLDRVDFVCSDVVDLDIQSESVDAALFIAALHHLPSSVERSRAVSEVMRILRPGGKALVSVWALEQDRFRDAMENQPPEMEPGDVLVPWTRQVDGRVFQRYIHLFTMEELLGLFEPDQVVEQFSRCDNHYVLVEKR